MSIRTLLHPCTLNWCSQDFGVPLHQNPNKKKRHIGNDYDGIAYNENLLTVFGDCQETVPLANIISKTG